MPSEIQNEVKESKEKKPDPKPKPVAQPNNQKKLIPERHTNPKNFIKRSQRVNMLQRKERHNIVQYIEMVDSWTQTSFHEEQYSK